MEQATGTVSLEEAAAPPRRERVIKRRRPGRRVSYVVLGVVVAMLINTLLTNPNFGWAVVGQYFTSVRILDGLVKTLQLTVISMVLGIVLGVVLAIMRLSSNPMMSAVSWFYIWFFRGTPLFVQLLFWDMPRPSIRGCRWGFLLGPASCRRTSTI